MKDYVVTKVGAGTMNFLPRVVRCETPREAAIATVKDLYWDEEAADVGFRQLPARKSEKEILAGAARVTKFKYLDGVLRVETRRSYVDIWNGRLTHHVRIRKDGSHVSTVRPSRERWES